MFTNTPFEALAKSMTENTPKFNPAALQEVIVPMQDNMKVWGEMAVNQAKAAQAAITDTVESFKNIKEPMAAFEVMKTSAENAVTLATKNLRDVTALSVSQFGATIDAVQKSHPAPEAFTSVGKSLKSAASTLESNLDSMLEKGASAMASMANAAPAATARKTRATA